MRLPACLRVCCVAGAFLTSACDLGTSIDDMPTSARVRVDGSAPEELRLISSIDFIEQLNLETGARSVLLLESDTMVIDLPFDETIDVRQTGSVYVELLYTPSSLASVNLRVELDNGERFEQAATMSYGAQLIYYWVWYGPAS